MKTTAAYLRVSTTGQSVNMQRDEIQTYCKNRGLNLSREFVDHGVSGSKASRPALDEMLQEVRRRKIETVIVWSLSRLGRSLKHLLQVVEDFQACGVTLISLKEGWDLSTSSGRMIFQVLGALAEWEREQIRDRVRSGVQAAKNKGKQLGRPEVAFDTDLARRMKAQGKSVREIAQALGISKSTVSRNIAKKPTQLVA